MKLKNVKRWFSLILLFSLFVTPLNSKSESYTMPTDLNEIASVYPIFDAICAAITLSPETLGQLEGPEVPLSSAFATSFLKYGYAQNSFVGYNEELLTNIQMQRDLLNDIFVSPIPENLTAIDALSVKEYVGFNPTQLQPNADSSCVDVVGEIYVASSQLSSISDHSQVSWNNSGLFTLQRAPETETGFRIVQFSLDSAQEVSQGINMHHDVKGVEYISSLGFSLLYPAIFEDQYLVETDGGVKASLPDESAHFSVTRTENVDSVDIHEHVQALNKEYKDEEIPFNELLQTSNVSYIDEEGMIRNVYYIITNDYIYRAELSYIDEHSAELDIFTEYLKNSFVASELSQG